VPCMWSDYILIYLHGWYVDIVYWARRVVTRPCLFIKREIESQSRINFSLELCILSRQFCFGTEWYYNVSICGKKTFVYSLYFVLLRRIIFYVNNIRSFCDILHTHPYIHIRIHLNVAQYLWSFKKKLYFCNHSCMWIEHIIHLPIAIKRHKKYSHELISIDYVYVLSDASPTLVLLDFNRVIFDWKCFNSLK